MPETTAPQRHRAPLNIGVCKSRYPKMLHLEGIKGHQFQPFHVTEDNAVQNGGMPFPKTQCYFVAKRGLGTYPQLRYSIHCTKMPRMAVLRQSKFPSISGPRISSSAMNTFPDITSSRATSLPDYFLYLNEMVPFRKQLETHLEHPFLTALRVGGVISVPGDISKTPGPGEVPSPAQVLPPQYQCSALRHGVHNTVFSSDCALGDTPSTEQLRRNCTIYRPWFSPYSYFVCTDKESHLETYNFPEVQRDEGREGRGDTGQPVDMAESICSSSSSLENACPRETTKKPRPGLDSKDYITSQDILTASKWHPAQQNGYKCVACCRMYPTMHSLKSHIKGGFKEGFSCKVYYRKLKTLWGKEQKARPGDRVSTSSCQTFK
ncbi:spermatogenesis-associated protein 46 isoform X2 [Macrotis lagotis]|uniref:spermatogenesis-associated protein 46 isoform X2 n=1 Tax=Macrotis lagotis TaxID=92651 RepID=UPI003D684335